MKTFGAKCNYHEIYFPNVKRRVKRDAISNSSLIIVVGLRELFEKINKSKFWEISLRDVINTFCLNCIKILIFTMR